METTKVVPANMATSLRSTIPRSIVKQLGLAAKDHLRWDLDKVDGEWVVVVRKA